VTASAAGGGDAAATDPRIAERRREVDADRRRGRRRRLVATAAVLAVVAGVVGLALSPVADVNEVAVDGAARSGTEAVIAAAGVRPGDPLVFVNAGRVASQVEGLGWVGAADVSVSWRTGEVRITVDERVPVAMAGTGDDAVAVDADGVVLGTLAPGERLRDGSPLPVIAPGDPVAPGGRLGEADRALVVVATALTPGLATQVAEVIPAAAGGVTLVLSSGAEVALGPVPATGENRVADQVRTLQTVLATVDLTGLASIDLAAGTTAVVARDPSGGQAGGQAGG
jgi:cell division protein FtsQ